MNKTWQTYLVGLLVGLCVAAAMAAVRILVGSFAGWSTQSSDIKATVSAYVIGGIVVGLSSARMRLARMDKGT